MPEINYAKAKAFGLSSSVTQLQLTAAEGAAGGDTFVTRSNAEAIFIAVSDVIREEKGMGVSEAREFTLALHPELRSAVSGR